MCMFVCSQFYETAMVFDLHEKGNEQCQLNFFQKGQILMLVVLSIYSSGNPPLHPPPPASHEQ